MSPKRLINILLLILTLTMALVAQTGRHPLKLGDIFRIREVRDPQVSPDGARIAYFSIDEQTKRPKLAVINHLHGEPLRFATTPGQTAP